MGKPINIPVCTNKEIKRRNRLSDVSDTYFDIGINTCPKNSEHHVILYFSQNGSPSYFKCKSCSYFKLYTMSY